MTGRMTEGPNTEKTCADGALLAARHLRKSFAGPSRMWPAEWWTGGGAIGELDRTRGEATHLLADSEAADSLAALQAAQSATTRAVDDVSLGVAAGETLAIVGESGSGKTTLARMLLRLIEADKPKHGLEPPEICFAGHDLLAATGGRLRALRRQMQMIFQDPVSSLDPRMRVAEIVGEPLEIHQPQTGRAARQTLVAETLATVGLDAASMRRFPHEFSGGQRQRIGIARALVLRPKLVVADEPISALDVSVGAQILELLRNLQMQFGLTYVLISHSLPVVAQLATTVAVMRAGRLVEIGTAEQVLHAPRHPYTRALLEAVPSLPE
jgi:ABC-type microcin C transport system duplicated ATPase subunit YejF